MELAMAALSSLLPKLGSLLTDEYRLQKGVRGEILFLQAEMESMQAALNRVSKLPSQRIDDLLNIWVRDLKELSYDIEDSVDTFMVRVDAPGSTKPHSFRRFFDRTTGLLTKAKVRHRIADDIQDIKRRIHDVSERKERYNSLDVVVQPHAIDIDPRLSALYEDAAKLVGIDGPTQKVVDLLTRGGDVQKDKLMVVSIVGVGGLGKTTIANAAYERLRGQFECQAFVSVSLKPNLKRILSSILRQVSKVKDTNAGEKDLKVLINSIREKDVKELNNIREKDVTELINDIREFLIDKRYLIVIDDIWDTEAWGIIKCALIDKNIGSRVIVTTRKIDVANFSSVDGKVYELDPLCREDSRMLLSKRVFNEEDGIYPELAEVTEKILKKCGGLPLAIITISSLLANIPNKTKREWYGVYNSMGSGLHKDRSLQNMRGILYLSYSDLPSYLKPCLLYLSMFPEDYEIPSDELVRLWIAEGFINENHGTNFYDVGERYLNELFNRSMVLPIYWNGMPRGCKVHDMILDLIISLSSQENFVTILEGPCHISSTCKIRRLSLRGSKVDSKEEQTIFPATVNTSHVRSLVVFGDATQWMPLLSRFPVLRVLALKTESINNIHANNLASMHYLRSLELETDVLEGIGNLKLLKTLDLWGPFKGELPAAICHLRQLESLLIGPYGAKLPNGIGNLMSLHELSYLHAEKSPNVFAELGNLTELRVLGIRRLEGNQSNVKTFVQSLSELGNLRTLTLCGSGILSLDCLPDQWRGPAHLQIFNGNYLTFAQVPRWFSSLSELSSLSICVNLLRQEDLELLGALPMLRFLNLEVCLTGTSEERLVVGAGRPFRALAEFNFRHYTRCCLVFARGVMPKLQRIRLVFGARGREDGSYVTGSENLASLKHVTVKVNCEGARISEVEDAETKVRDAIDKHLNHPTLELSRAYEYKMITDDSEESESQRN